MSQQDRSPMEQAALALYFHAAQMIKEGKTREQIERHLIHDKGVSPKTAKIMLDKLNDSRANVARKLGWRNAVTGAFVVAASLLIIFGVLSGERATGVSLAVCIVLLMIGGWFVLRGTMQITGMYRADEKSKRA